MLGHDIADALTYLRAEAESLMTDTCTVAYPTGTTADPTTGADVTTYGDAVYSGRCKVQDRDLQSSEPESASSTADVYVKELHLPVSAPTIAHGAHVLMSDGRVFRVLAGHRKTWQTAQRLPVEVVS